MSDPIPIVVTRNGDYPVVIVPGSSAPPSTPPTVSVTDGQGRPGPQGPAGLTLTSTDGSPGGNVYVGTTDPYTGHTPVEGDVWMQPGAPHGTTSQRPSVSSTDIGFSYYDSTIGKPIWWNGTVWKDSQGTTV